MENIYFQPNKENSEFLAKLEKLDEYTIPQILERMVDHFRKLPELEDALNKLGIKTDSLEEKLDDDIKVKETFWLGGKPKRLRHFKGDDPDSILEKEWYQSGQLKTYGKTEKFNELNTIHQMEIHRKFETKSYYIQGNLSSVDESYSIGYKQIIYKYIRRYYRNGQLGLEILQEKGETEENYYDMDGNRLENNSAFHEHIKRLGASYKGEKGENRINVHPFGNEYDK